MEPMQAATTVADLYASLPLASVGLRQIRILEIEEPVDRDEREITSTMKIINLDDDKPQFVALSYVWGPPSPAETISCGGCQIQVTANCRSALWRLRKINGAMSIWVDSICINQEAIEEKQHQLPLMRDIYSRADQVYIWLGEGTPESDAAIDVLKGMGFQKYLGNGGELGYTVPSTGVLSWRAAWELWWEMRAKPLREFKSRWRQQGKDLFVPVRSDYGAVSTWSRCSQGFCYRF